MSCPPGKVVVGSGYRLNGNIEGSGFDNQTDFVVTDLALAENYVYVAAYEEEPSSLSWRVTAQAMCATAP